MKTRFLPLVFIVSFLLPVQALHAASGGNPGVFASTAKNGNRILQKPFDWLRP